jgi:ABC-type multidrug transport system fused ATPase/permease subunit
MRPRCRSSTQPSAATRHVLWRLLRVAWEYRVRCLGVLALQLLVLAGRHGSYMLSKHVTLTLVSFATTPLLWLLTMRFSQRVRPAHDRSRERLDELVLRVSETVHGVQLIGWSSRSGCRDERPCLLL